ncbi:MAG: SDR family oxidoreductase [Coriobacteriia bacterium]|nr:SDR family oxidoreductase [Coriobacteriia bacterium]
MLRTSVLVTGGAGFIGSHIVDALLADGGYQVRVLDNFATGRRENLAHCLSSIELIEGDIRDMEIVEEAVAGVECILHQAALPSVPRSVKAPVTTNDVNVGGTLKLLSAAHKAGVRRVVFASSSSVYGDGQELPKHEGMAPRPMSPYAVTKLAGENYLRVFADIYGMETLAIRYFNVFGPRQDPASYYSGVIAKFMTAALEGGRCVVNGDGMQARDFTYVDNVVHANLLALKAPQLDGHAVNVACGERYTLLDLIAGINEAAGVQLSVEYREARVGDVKYSQAAIERAREVLGYEPLVCFKDGIVRTFNWYAGKR